MTELNQETKKVASDSEKANLSGLLIKDREAHRFWNRKNALIVLLFFGALFWFVPFVPALYFNTITVTRLDAKGKPIDVEVGPGTKQWIAIEKVSRHIVNAVIVAEDGKFYEHNGFDFEAIQKAIELNRKKGRYVRGASTISQQVIKMSFLSREKTIIRKVREAMGTVLMELIMPKDKIIEWYINLCEFGGGIYGVKPAGMYYFKTRPELLTIEQAVNLAVVIPSPNKWSKGLRAKSLTPFGERRFARIVKNMFLAGYITEVQKNTALARGNFGNPIAGFGGGDEDDDDCRGDKECEESGADSKNSDGSTKSDSGKKNFTDGQGASTSENQVTEDQAPVENPSSVVPPAGVATEVEDKKSSNEEGGAK